MSCCDQFHWGSASLVRAASMDRWIVEEQCSTKVVLYVCTTQVESNVEANARNGPRISMANEAVSPNGTIHPPLAGCRTQSTCTVD